MKYLVPFMHRDLGLPVNFFALLLKDGLQREIKKQHKLRAFAPSREPLHTTGFVALHRMKRGKS